MTPSVAPRLLDLPDEMLMHIMSNVPSLHLLHSCTSACERLDRLARDRVHTRSIDLTASTLTKAMLDHFCDHILPRIHHRIQSLTLDAATLQRVSQSVACPNVRKLVVTELDLDRTSEYFDVQTPANRSFEEQIRYLVVAVIDRNEWGRFEVASTNGYLAIFNRFSNVTHLQFSGEDNFRYPPLTLRDLPSTAFHSSTITHLSVKVLCSSDCARLLDGRLSHLHTFTVKICLIDSSDDANSTDPLPRLKCFSMISLRRTSEFDRLVLPLLHRMSALEQLSLSLVVENRSAFVDGTCLENEIRNRMPQLATFNFDILTAYVDFADPAHLPSAADIRQTFAANTSAQCYVDCTTSGRGRCHVYSVPFAFHHMRGLTNQFPGGQFNYVHKVALADITGAFEHEFFERISRSFPRLTHLTVFNAREPTRSNNTPVSAPVEYAHLIELDVHANHIAYVAQFLDHTRARMPRLAVLNVVYEQLVGVTNGFTSEITRLNCATVKRVITDQSMAHSEDFFRYFPLL